MKCGCPRRTRDMRCAIVAQLAPIFGAQYVTNRKPSDGPMAPDITAPHVSITCLRAPRTDARAVLREALLRGRFPDEWVVAVCQDDRQRPYVAMSFEDFTSLLGEWQMLRMRDIKRDAT
jgi:hypothetical protein